MITTRSEKATQPPLERPGEGAINAVHRSWLHRGKLGWWPLNLAIVLVVIMAPRRQAPVVALQSRDFGGFDHGFTEACLSKSA